MKRWGLLSGSVSTETKPDRAEMNPILLNPNVLSPLSTAVYIILVNTLPKIKLNSFGFSIIG